MRVDERNTKKIPKRRRRKHRKLSKFSYCLILLLVFLCAVAVCVAVFCKIDKIEVVGKSQYSNEEIISASKIELGTNLFLVKKDLVSENIETKLPYVTNVKVSYKLPTQIKIEVSTASAKYSIKQNDKYILLDENFKVLEVNASEDKATGKVLISGSTPKNLLAGNSFEVETQEQLESLNLITQAIKKDSLKDVTEINISNKYELSVTYNNRITIILGTEYNLEDKLNHASLICNNNLQESDEGTLDVSTTDKRYIFTPKSS